MAVVTANVVKVSRVRAKLETVTSGVCPSGFGLTVIVLGESKRHDVTGVGDAMVMLLVGRGLSGGKTTTGVQSGGTGRCLVGVGGLSRSAPTANEVATKVGQAESPNRVGAKAVGDADDVVELVVRSRDRRVE